MGQQILSSLLQGGGDALYGSPTSGFTNRQALSTLGQNNKDMSVVMKFLERNLSLTGTRNYSLVKLPSGNHKSNNTITERSSDEGWDSDPKERPSISDYSSSRPAESNRPMIEHPGEVDGSEKLQIGKDNRHSIEEPESAPPERLKKIGRAPTFGLRYGDTVFLERHMPRTLTKLMMEFTESEIFKHSTPNSSPYTKHPQPIAECSLEESGVFAPSIDYSRPVGLGTPSLFRAQFKSPTTVSPSPYTKDSPFPGIGMTMPNDSPVMNLNYQIFPKIGKLLLGKS
jgi:AraC-like DNA-binding protein